MFFELGTKEWVISFLMGFLSVAIFEAVRFAREAHILKDELADLLKENDALNHLALEADIRAQKSRQEADALRCKLRKDEGAQDENSSDCDSCDCDDCSDCDNRCKDILDKIQGNGAGAGRVADNNAKSTKQDGGAK